MKPYSLLRHIGVLVVASITMTLVSPGQIASADGTLCYGLAAKDCQILMTAESSVNKEASFQANFALTFNLNGTGLGATANSKGIILFSYDPTLTDNLDATLKSVVMKLDGTLMTSSRGFGPTPVNQKSTLALVIVNGISYQYVNPTLGWVGYEFDEHGLNSTRETLSDSFWTGAERGSNPAIMQGFRTFLEDPSIPIFLSSLQNIPGFIKLKRTANAPGLDGQRMIEFLYTYDLPTLIKSDEFHPVLKRFLEFSLNIVGRPDQAALLTDNTISNSAIIFSRIFTGSTFTITRWVGSKDNLFHAVLADMSLNYNPSMLGISSLKPGTVKGHFEVKLTKLNKPIPTVTAPQDALLLITPSPTPTDTPSITPTASDTPSATPTATNTPSATSTPSPSNTSTYTPTATDTDTPIPSATPTLATEAATADIGTPG